MELMKKRSRNVYESKGEWFSAAVLDQFAALAQP
jgi:hypothetical protein